MAISVNYATTAPWLITVPKSDLVLETGTQYSLGVDAFWLLLRDYTDNEITMARPKLYSRIPATSSTPSITTIDLDYYRIEFEDGLYSVNIGGGNTNIREAEIKNMVSVNTNNTTGFINPTFLEYSTFSGAVWLDQINGETGLQYPIGTPAQPVGNLTDALAIALDRGIHEIDVLGNADITGALNFQDFKFKGQARNLTLLTIDASVNVINATFEQATVTGTLDGDSFLVRCAVQDLNFVSGVILNCSIEVGTITLGGGVSAKLYDCESGLPGLAAPTIDFGGSGQSLAVRGYNGGLKLINKTGSDPCSIDLVSGQVRIDLTTVTNGTITVRGTGKLINDATGDWLPSGTYGGLVLNNETVHGQMLQDLWQLMGLDKASPLVVTPTSRQVADIDQVISGDGITTSTVTRQ